MNYQNISIFFPAFNEELAIEKTVNNALSAVAKKISDFEIIIVDDGSTDRTGEIADKLAKENKNIRVIHHPVNKGYGAAVKSGLAASTKDLIFFSDGDNQFDISEINLLLPLIEKADIAAGYRLKRRDSFHRILFAKMFGALMGVFFNLWIKDIDCAFKLIKREVIRGMELKSEGAMISSELLIKAKKKGFTIKQVGVHHYPRKGGSSTGGKPWVVFKAFYEIIKLWRELR